jgi:hypothetical protein
MRYKDFISEVRNLIEEADLITKSGATHENPRFRDWRHHAESLVNEVTALGYRLPGKFESSRRSYRAMYPGASQIDDASALAKELNDSVIELRYLIAQYEKYGTPKQNDTAERSTSVASLPSVSDQVDDGKNRKSLKERFESHPVPWGLGLIVVGFLAGFGARAYVLPVPSKEVSCTVDGLASVEEAHSKEINTLNAELTQLEANAVKESFILPGKDNYKQAADRIRQDIEQSNRTYLAVVESLQKKCK